MELRKIGASSERVIIYCQTIKVVSHVYGVFKGDLGGDMYVTQGDPKSSMVEMYITIPELTSLISRILLLILQNQMATSEF